MSGRDAHSIPSKRTPSVTAPFRLASCRSRVTFSSVSLFAAAPPGCNFAYSQDSRLDGARGRDVGAIDQIWELSTEFRGRRMGNAQQWIHSSSFLGCQLLLLQFLSHPNRNPILGPIWQPATSAAPLAPLSSAHAPASSSSSLPAAPPATAPPAPQACSPASARTPLRTHTGSNIGHSGGLSTANIERAWQHANQEWLAS